MEKREGKRGGRRDTRERRTPPFRLTLLPPFAFSLSVQVGQVLSPSPGHFLMIFSLFFTSFSSPFILPLSHSSFPSHVPSFPFFRPSSPSFLHISRPLFRPLFLSTFPVAFFPFRFRGKEQVRTAQLHFFEAGSKHVHTF